MRAPLIRPWSFELVWMLLTAAVRSSLGAIMKTGLSCCAAALVYVAMQASSTWAQGGVNTEIAPNGRLRGAVIGIRMLGGFGEPIGRFIAGKIGATFKPVNYPTPQAYEASFGKNQWDIALGPRVLAPADKADVTPDVWLIEFPADAIELLRGGKANVFGADAGLIAAIAGGYPDAKAVPGSALFEQRSRYPRGDHRQRKPNCSNLSTRPRRPAWSRMHSNRPASRPASAWHLNS